MHDSVSCINFGSNKLNYQKNDDCHFAGRFNLLGGPTEQPWAFNRLFKLDITTALKEYGLKPEDVFDAEAQFRLEVKVYDVEGHILPLKDVMPEPTIIFSPAHGTHFCLMYISFFSSFV